MSATPTQTCTTCGRVVDVDFYARGFPPDSAKRKLQRLCKVDGHNATPEYRAGLQFGGPVVGQSATPAKPAMPLPNALEAETE